MVLLRKWYDVKICSKCWRIIWPWNKLFLIYYPWPLGDTGTGNCCLDCYTKAHLKIIRQHLEEE